MKTIKFTLFVIVVLLASTTPTLAAERWLEGYKKVLVICIDPHFLDTLSS